MLKLTRFIRPYRKYVIVGPIFKLFEAIFELILPLLMARLIDNGILKHDVGYVWHMGGLMLLFSVIGLACVLVCQYSASVASMGFGTELRRATYEKINTFSNRELDHFGTSTLITRMTSDINLVQNALALMIRLVIRAPFLSIGSIIMAAMIDWRMGLIFLVILPLFSLIVYVVMVKTVPLYKKVQQKIDEFNLDIAENITGVRVIRAFAKRQTMEKEIDGDSNQLAKTYRHVGNIAALTNPLTTLLLNLGTLAVLSLSGYQVNLGSMTQGDVLALINYLTYMLAALTVVANITIYFTRASASASRIDEVLTTKVSIQSPDAPVALPTTTDAPILDLQHVSFGYQKGAANALDDISFTLLQHKWLGVTGPTGSGKTTLLELVLRFYDPTSGTIQYSGDPLNKVDLTELRHQIGDVSQKTVLFAGTVRDNLKFGNPDATEADMWWALDVAQASSFIKPLAKQLDSPVAAMGANFSGGQRQRLAIARAVIRKPKLLLLDDALSALDYQTDLNLRLALQDQLKETTMIIVSQRLSSIKDADQILVLDNGKQVGLGTHAELLKTSPVYQKIVATQQNMEGVKSNG
ncbi:ABC transporter, ATP-binding permease [Lactobacillus selangorensis]|uniref:ABC transporter, ATP-binding permease n=1 Tax=Lactobacillus selangorensis TaxID=81857 RepID=A0A0R2FYA6_9LACO|nr:ABC transporter ATP-binding protein [Lactobacillus selangorensis]KRN28010.1 ABC transporter, ATP-binding permease [Lactobacillus selangorensis]KRN30519.1 ABC transporter, ATP-binding permease [Lactobacillus selangorensis]